MKAILVVDIPEKYELDQLAVNYMLYSVDGKILDGDMGRELKPLPQKKEFGLELQGCYDQIFEYHGYNKCIDEILGEQK